MNIKIGQIWKLKPQYFKEYRTCLGYIEQFTFIENKVKIGICPLNAKYYTTCTILELQEWYELIEEQEPMSPCGCFIRIHGKEFLLDIREHARRGNWTVELKEKNYAHAAEFTDLQTATLHFAKHLPEVEELST